MANNFRIVGNWYVSTDGSDANAGNAPDAPFRSIGAAVTAASAGQTIVLGAGVYNENISIARRDLRFIADGTVVIEQISGTENFIFSDAAQSVVTFTDIIFRGFISGSTYVGASGNLARVIANNCIFVNCRVRTNETASNGTNMLLTSCIFVNSLIEIFSTATVERGTQFIGCSLINTSVSNNETLAAGGSQRIIRNCYVDAVSNIQWGATATQPIFENNDYEGTMTIGASTYSLSQDVSGNPVALIPGTLDLASVAAYTSVYNTSFKQNPEWFNSMKGDFRSVLPSSPLIRRGVGGVNIGNVRSGTGKKYNVDAELTVPNATIIGLSNDAGDLVVTSAVAYDAGTITSAPILISPTPQVVARVNFAQALVFNIAQAAGTSGNKNVPIKTDYTAGTAGANPQRLTYEMRWTDQSAMPTTDAGWTNNGYTAPGTWVVFELNTIPLVNNGGIGNGDPAFNSALTGRIAATWVEVRVRLQNGLQP